MKDCMNEELSHWVIESLSHWKREVSPPMKKERPYQLLMRIVPWLNVPSFSFHRPTRIVLPLAGLLAFGAAGNTAARAARVTLRAETSKSDFHIELGRAGLFKAFGDDHLIRVTDYDCTATLDESDPAGSSVRMAIRTASLRVVDPPLSPDKRDEVQKRMQGPEVLEIARFPEIAFQSHRITVAGPDRFRVEGELRIRDVARPVVLEVFLSRAAEGRRARGEARIRQTTFGIQPVSAGGGTVKVKNEIKIVFDFVLVPSQP